MKNKKEVSKESKYKAIIFDMGEVLSLGKKNKDMEGIHELVAKKLGFTLDAYFDAIDSTYAKAMEGRIPRAKAVSLMARNLETSEKKLVKVYTKAYKRNFKRNHKLFNFALNLKKQGYKIGIISDIWYIAKDVFFHRYYYDHFDLALASCDVGSRKSDKKIFRIALKKLNVPPEETIFTDDKKWNLTAPKSMGITTIQFKNNNQLLEKLKSLGVYAK